MAIKSAPTARRTRQVTRHFTSVVAGIKVVQFGLSALKVSAKRSGAWHLARHSDTARVARRAPGMSSVEQWGTARDAEAAPVCRALLVAALEKFYHSCSQGLRFIAVATVHGADDAANVLRVPSSPPLLSAPLL